MKLDAQRLSLYLFGNAEVFWSKHLRTKPFYIVRNVVYLGRAEHMHSYKVRPKASLTLLSVQVLGDTVS